MTTAYLRTSVSLGLLTAMALLSACGGGGGGTNSTPTPSPSPTPSPTPTPPAAPAVNYDTAEYQLSDGPVAHGAITAYEAGASGNGITVGVIDTGINSSSAEFTGRISSASASFGGSAGFQDEDGHGTAVATVLAAARNGQKTLGMAWEATIMALRTDDPTDCDEDGCKHSTVAIGNALDHAVANGARAINISLGGSDASPALRAAIQRATAAGTIIVIAAGNEGDAEPDGFATSLAGPDISNGLVILVTSNNSDGTHSGFTRGGDANGALGYENVTLSALGNEVRAQDNTGTEYLWEGTSLAAPQVSGAVALMLEAFPNLSPQEVVDQLLTTAQDAGAVGPDADFGMGILDVAAAFEPAGATTLGSSQTPVSLTENGSLSAAMGDAAGTTGTQAVAIDTLGRAYQINIQRTLTPGRARAVLTPLRDAPRRSASLGLGKLSAAFNIADAVPLHNRFGETMTGVRANALSGQFALPLNRSTSVGLAFQQGGASMAAALGDNSSASSGFLAAQDAHRSFGFQPSPDFAIALNHRLSPHVSLSLSGENGALVRNEVSRLRNGRQEDDRHYRYVSAAMNWASKPASLSLSASLLDEDKSLLGAQFSSFLGVNKGQTLFADAQANIALPKDWSLGLSARRGWTKATGDGNAQLGTMAWAADLSRVGILHRADRFGLRISQPLRVVSGGVDALLPTAHDYASGESLWTMQRINLSPKGREIDAEMRYARPFAGGWLSLNGYWRSEPGHIDWASDDIGGAVRFSVGY